MPRVVRTPQSVQAMRQQARGPRNSVNDRPSRLKLLLRRQRRLLRPAACLVIGAALLVPLAAVFHSGGSGGLLGNLRDRVARSAAAAGLTVTDVIIEGRGNTPENLLNAAIGASRGDPILGFSVEAARARIESLAGVQHAPVERRLPGTIGVALEERRPFAVWQHDAKSKLIDRAGVVVTDQEAANFKELPLVVGLGAPKAAALLLDARRDPPPIATHLIAPV